MRPLPSIKLTKLPTVSLMSLLCRDFSSMAFAQTPLWCSAAPALPSPRAEADGTSAIEVRGLPGASAGLEVSSDLNLWDPVETVTLSENDVVQRPSTGETNPLLGIFRLNAP